MPMRLKGGRLNLNINIMDFIYSLVCKIPFIKKFIEVEEKGKFAWLVDVVEILIVIVYFWVFYLGIKKSISSFDFADALQAYYGAVWFLVIATVANSVLCVLRPFTSKGNRLLVIWNVIWILFTVYELLF